jgi:hypothetical protein
MCFRVHHAGGDNPMVVQTIVQRLSSTLRNGKSVCLEPLCRCGIAVKNEGLAINAREPADGNALSIVFLRVRQQRIERQFRRRGCEQ